MTGIDLAFLALILAGLVGVVTVVLPGMLLVWGGVVGWAFVVDTPYRWPLVVGVTVLLAVAQVVKVLVPGRRLKDAGVPTTSIAVAGGAGIVGFFVIPVVGLFVGFVLGMFLAELARLGTPAAARPSTLGAIKAVGLSIVLELFFALVMTAAWAAAVWRT